MRIDPKGSIAGRPALEIRNLLRRGMGYQWTSMFVCERLDVSEAEAQRVIDELLREGYIERDDTFPGHLRWRNTVAGNALAMASAAKPVRRATAEKKVTEFLERVRRVNEDAYYLYKVTRVEVFGSYLTDREKLNDVDIAVELEPRYLDGDQQQAYEQERVQEAARQGRTFRHFTDAMAWPRTETLLFLKSRSRTISLHDISDLIRMQAESRTLFVADDSPGKDQHPLS